MDGIKQLSLVIRVIVGLMLLFAVGDHPYAYYQVLRIVVFGASLFLVWYFIQAKVHVLGWIFLVPAILFNPILPIYMEKSSWQTLDLLFGLVFLASVAACGKERKLV